MNNTIAFRCPDDAYKLLLSHRIKEDKNLSATLIRLIRSLNKEISKPDLVLEKLNDLEIYITDQVSVINKHTTRQVNSLSQL